jgi:outer membrane protein assembly factor BamB
MRCRTWIACLLVLALVTNFCGRPDDPLPLRSLEDRMSDLQIDWDANTIRRSDAAGNTLWTTQLDGALLMDGGSIVRDDRRICVGHGNGVTALDNGSGKVLWHVNGVNTSMLLSGDLLVAAGFEDVPGCWVVARSVKDGSRVFKTRLRDDFEPMFVREVADLFAVVNSLATDNRPWESVLLDQQMRVRFEFDRQVIAGTRQGNDYVFLTSTDIVRVSPGGKTSWRIPLESDFGEGGGLISLPGGDVVAFRYGVIEDSGVQVLRFRPADGSVPWNRLCDGLGVPHSMYRHKATAAIERDTVLVISRGSGGNFTEQLDLSSGRQLRRAVHRRY